MLEVASRSRGRFPWNGGDQGEEGREGKSVAASSINLSSRFYQRGSLVVALVSKLEAAFRLRRRYVYRRASTSRFSRSFRRGMVIISRAE